MAVTITGDKIITDVNIKKSSATGLSVENNIVRYPNRPTFSVYGNTNTAVGSIMTFSKTSVNVGNCMNPATGVFQAPVDGVYEFSWGAISATANDVYRYRLRVNNVQLSGLDFHLRHDTLFTGSEYANNTAFTLIFPLSALDTVHILYNEGSTLLTFLDNWYFYFNGWLVK